MAPLFFLIELFSPFVEIQAAYFSDLTHADYIHNSIFESKQSCVLTMWSFNVLVCPSALAIQASGPFA